MAYDFFKMLHENYTFPKNTVSFWFLAQQWITLNRNLFHESKKYFGQISWWFFDENIFLFRRRFLKGRFINSSTIWSPLDFPMDTPFKALKECTNYLEKILLFCDQRSPFLRVRLRFTPSIPDSGWSRLEAPSIPDSGWLLGKGSAAALPRFSYTKIFFFTTNIGYL